MKLKRKTATPRKIVRRRSPALSLSARVARLEKLPMLRDALNVRRAVKVAVAPARYVNLGADGKPTVGEHVAVYDRTTGLTWSAAPLLDGKSVTHGDAMKAAADCRLLGHKDWRTPTITELLSIVDYELYDPAVPKAHFRGDYGWTWSSTPFKGNSGAAWFVNLSSGDSDWFNHGYLCHARAVRAGQPLGLLG